MSSSKKSNNFDKSIVKLNLRELDKISDKLLTDISIKNKFLVQNINKNHKHSQSLEQLNKKHKLSTK